MEEMKWFSSALHGVLAANNLGFGLDLAEICQTFRPATVPQGHGVSKISGTESSQHGFIAHWTHMEEMKYGSAVPCFMCWLQTTLVLAWLWLRSTKANLLARDSASRT
jgi:hypothetical protein